MFSFLLKARFYWKILTFIKQWGFSFLILFVSIFLISYIHSEYISWMEESKPSPKFLLTLILICIGIFLSIIFFKIKQLKKLENTELNIDHTRSEKFKKLKAKRLSGELKTEYDRILEGSDDEK